MSIYLGIKMRNIFVLYFDHEREPAELDRMGAYLATLGN